MNISSHQNQHDITDLEGICLERTVHKNTLLINEGDETDRLFVLLNGTAYALRRDETGKQVIVNRFGPFDYFGEMSLFYRSALCATVITKEKCGSMILTRKAFFYIVRFRF